MGDERGTRAGSWGPQNCLYELLVQQEVRGRVLVGPGARTGSVWELDPRKALWGPREAAGPERGVTDTSPRLCTDCL